MTYARDAFDNPPRMPPWVRPGDAASVEDAAFRSGAALAHLHQVLGRNDVPQALLRDRLALAAAEACVTLQGRPERAADLRDALAFLHPGDSPGPAGEVGRLWHQATRVPVSVTALGRAMPTADADRIAGWLDAGQGAPVARAASVLETVLADRPRAPETALLLADAALAQALGWRHVLPLLAPGLRRADLRRTSADLRLACHRAIARAATDAARTAADLARRAARLAEVAPKLRAKGSDQAVALFLGRDALAPTALTSLRSDRAARRFCDRLVDLGAVEELTGRETFRLYGL